MSQGSKISFLVGLIALVAYAITHVMFGGLNLDVITLGIFSLSVLSAIIFDRKLYLEFLSMRTTKHGMNMGFVILLMVVGVVCVNYIAFKHNQTWDLTREKANSLSDQTRKILDGLKDDLSIKLFYRGAQSAEAKQAAQPALTLYRDYSGRVKIRNVNALVEEELAIDYLKDQPDVRTAPIMCFVEYKGKRVRVDEPIDEEKLTSAIIRATREGETKVYVVQGHGEHDFEGRDDAGLGELGKALKEGSFKAETLNLIDAKEIPADAATVAILGPASAYLEGEIETLRRYVKRGGNLLIALDPGQRHNLANLTKPLGVEFENNYVLSPKVQIQGGGPATILGRSFDPGSEITRNVPSGSFAIFPLASELKATGEKDVKTHDLVKSDPSVVTVSDPRHVGQLPAPRQVTLAFSAEGPGEGGKTWRVVIFGDSDFATNRGIYLGVNRDLVLNAFAYLTNQKDLLSIRPKVPPGTMVTLTNASSWLIFITSLGLPFLLLVSSLVIWFRRRGA